MNKGHALIMASHIIFVQYNYGDTSSFCGISLTHNPFKSIPIDFKSIPIDFTLVFASTGGFPQDCIYRLFFFQEWVKQPILIMPAILNYKLLTKILIIFYIKQIIISTR